MWMKTYLFVSHYCSGIHYVYLLMMTTQLVNSRSYRNVNMKTSKADEKNFVTECNTCRSAVTG